MVQMFRMFARYVAPRVHALSPAAHAEPIELKLAYYLPYSIPSATIGGAWDDLDVLFAGSRGALAAATGRLRDVRRRVRLVGRPPGSPTRISRLAAARLGL
ncbi:MAG: hypothetical protein WCA12_17050 [Burkholderiales bacterium]